MAEPQKLGHCGQAMRRGSSQLFVDKVSVKIKAGKGGDGKLSFRHEKFVSRGGPDGGDGGDGGNVVALASNNQNTLANFRYKKEIFADPGKNGEKRKKHGKNGKDLIVKLPVGTVIYGPDDRVLADLTEDGQREIIALGGKGGYGNAHFVSSTRRAPKVAEKGEPGEEFEAVLELKMLADVGLVGLPNAGKSTLLGRISNARPEIANYPFTTLNPNLGVVDMGNASSILFADIPGLIEGASHGKGLGDEFLRHVERTKLLVHMIDAYQDDVVQSYRTIQKELADYAVDLSKKPQIIAINKIDGLDEEIAADLVKKLKKAAPRKKVTAISAQSGQGVQELLRETQKLLEKSEKKTTGKIKEKLPVIRLATMDDSWKVAKTKEGFKVSGKKIERFALRTDFESEAGVQRLRDIMRKLGVMHELERKKIQPGDKIIFDNIDKRMTY
ncbi:MAG TPA: GTPase ObgE [Candidatus Saccharimonadales bacterium]|nr:GTPase ObgE [Candidatus Saccharimonadales bacterium]